MEEISLKGFEIYRKKKEKKRKKFCNEHKIDIVSPFLFKRNVLKVRRKSGHKLCDRFSFKIKGRTYSFI